MPAETPVLTLRERLHVGASLMLPVAALWLMSRAGWLPLKPWWCLAALPLAVLIGTAFPRPFAGWRRITAAFQSWIGRRLIAFLLGLIFVAVVIPVGWLLRWRGKSFLDRSPRESYWKPAPVPGSLRQQY